MQIHHIITTNVDRFVLDPTLGPVKRRELVMKQSDVQTIASGGHTYEMQPDLTFEVPPELGNFYLTHKDKDGSWHEGPNPFAAYLEEETETPHPAKRTAAKSAAKAGS